MPDLVRHGGHHLRLGDVVEAQFAEATADTPASLTFYLRGSGASSASGPAAEAFHAALCGLSLDLAADEPPAPPPPRSDVAMRSGDGYAIPRLGGRGDMIVVTDEGQDTFVVTRAEGEREADLTFLGFPADTKLRAEVVWPGLLSFVPVVKEVKTDGAGRGWLFVPPGPLTITATRQSADARVDGASAGS